METNETATIEDLAKQLKRLIDDEATTFSQSDNKFQTKYEMLVYDLKRELENAESLYNDYEDQKLTFNTIEAEGFLRAMKTVKGHLDFIEENY